MFVQWRRRRSPSGGEEDLLQEEKISFRNPLDVKRIETTGRRTVGMMKRRLRRERGNKR